MADIDLSTLTPRDQDAADSVVVMKEGSPDDMGLVPRARFQSAQVITGVPAVDQANFSPAGFGATVGAIKLQPTTGSVITGIAAGATDQFLRLINDSTHIVVLALESTASTAANRFREGSLPSRPILPQESVDLRYSATLSRWVVADMSLDVYGLSPRSQMMVAGTSSVVPLYGVGVAAGSTFTTVNPLATPTRFMDEGFLMQAAIATVSGVSNIRSGSLPFARGATADRQGFFHTAIARFPALANVTGSVRSGLMSSTANSAVQNAAMTQCLLLGADTTMTTLRVFAGSATAGTPVDLGANFPVPSATAEYEYFFYAPPATASVRYLVRRLDSHFVAQGTLSANIPTDTTFLGQRIEASVGATAAQTTVQATHLLTVGL